MTTASTPAQAPIGDHAFLSDQRTAALVTRDGDIDWLCMPRFDSGALLCSILGDPENGHWRLGIADGRVTGRRYRPGTMILETTWEAPTGTALVTELLQYDGTARDGEDTDDFSDHADLIRRVECTSGSVEVEQTLRIRFEYGQIVPWMRSCEDVSGETALTATAGAEAVALHGPSLTPEGRSHRGRHRIGAGDALTWSLTWYPSWADVPVAPSADRAIETAERAWREWLGEVRVAPEHRLEVERSLLVLRGLTHRRTGGIVAAATASLPEDLGGERNWDYRYCWLRDAALSLEALLTHGHVGAATQWRDWLLRAIAGDPQRLQIMYGVAGERQLPERELDHLTGYAGSRPVRVGNGAVTQFQADVIGEVLIALSMLRDHGVEEDAWSWPLQRHLLRFAAEHVDVKDQGLWEMRGEPEYFTHSRIMVWAAFDRGLHAVEAHGLPASDEEIELWRGLRERLRTEILEHGVDERGAFTQVYGGSEVDASLLHVPRTGFIAVDDPRMLATVERIEEDLLVDGLVLRYRTRGQDGLTGHEHPFLVCCFWLVGQYAAMGRRADAEALMERTLACGNDLKLLSEEYDPEAGLMIGNFPQAFSHLGLIQAVDALSDARSQARSVPKGPDRR